MEVVYELEDIFDIIIVKYGILLARVRNDCRVALLFHLDSSYNFDIQRSNWHDGV